MVNHSWHKIDETERRTWQNPEEVLKIAGLRSGLTFADIGCGQGFFTIPAARIVGPSGKIYALDINDASIQVVRNKASEENLTWVESFIGPAEHTLICSGCVDIVFFGIVLHDFDDPVKVLQNAHKMLKQGGKLVNLDWKKEDMSMGPPLSKRFDEGKASQLIESSGFKIENIQNSGRYSYLIVSQVI